MMPHLPAGWQWLVFALSLSGFLCLALASQREGATLLGRPPGPKLRRGLHALGWPLLAVALGVCMVNWQASFGTVLWFGWLTLAALGLVFAIAYWPWRRKATPAGRRRVAVEQETRLPWAVRSVLALVLISIPLTFGWSLWQAEPWPVLRADAVQGEIGPWHYRLAEEEREAPEVLSNGMAVKHFMLRLEGDELAVARAWLRVQPPRSLRTAGMAFEGSHGNREAMLVIPPSATELDAFWLTVQDKDGQVYQVKIAMRRLSPATAEFVEGRQ